MQSRTISERIQASAQFCASAFSDRDAGAGLVRQLTLRQPRKQAQSQRRAIRTTRRVAPSLPKITVFSETCRKSCGRWARLGRMNLSLGPRTPKKRKHGVLLRTGKGPCKPRFARAPRPLEREVAIIDARKAHDRLRQAIDMLPQG